MTRARLLPCALALCVLPTGPGRSAGHLPLPPASAALEFEPGASEVGLDVLLQRLAHLTGQELAMTPQTLQILRQSKEPLERTDPVPPAEVYAFVEGLLARQGFVIAPVTGGTRPILGVLASSGGRDGQLDPLYVDSASLDELATHPALLVRVLLSLKYIDTRQLQTQLRQLLVDNSGVLQCVPVGEHSLILQGRGSDIASLAKLLFQADEAAGKEPRPAPKPDAGGTK